MKPMKQPAHTHTQAIIKIDEYGDYYFWKCSCGAIGGQNIEPGELEDLIKLTTQW